MKSLPEEIAYRIASISYNPFFYLINGVWNKANFDTLISKNYTFPSLVRILIRSGEKKIFKKLLVEYEDVIKSFPDSLQNDINNLLTYPGKENGKFRSRKISETNIFIPQLKTLTADDIRNHSLNDLIDKYLKTGEYTYIRKESDMEDLIQLVKEEYQGIKESLVDKTGSIPSATEKRENPKFSFIYLYALVSSINFPMKWNKLLAIYHPYFIKIKVTENDLEIFQWFNHAFQCQNIETIKQTYGILKEIYHECRLCIKNSEYMDFIFKHPHYEPIIRDSINNLPLTTWKVLHPNEGENKEQNGNGNGNGNGNENKNKNENLFNQWQDLILPPDEHNILYILTHNFYLGSYPSCHLFYLYDQYIEDILKFYDEDNDQIFRYYSSISSNPDYTLISLFYYTALILFLRSPYIQCQLADPEEEMKAKKEVEKERLRKIQPSIIHTLFNPDKKVILLTNPLYASSLNVEQLLPHLSTSNPSSVNNESNGNEPAKANDSSSSTSENKNLNHIANDTVTQEDDDEEDDEYKEIKKKFRYHIQNPKERISYISVNINDNNNNNNNNNNTNKNNNSNILPTPPYLNNEINGTSSLNYKRPMASTSSSSITSSSPSSSSSPMNEHLKEEKEKPLKHVRIFIKNNLLSFTSQTREWKIKRRRSLIDSETYDQSTPHQREMYYYTAAKTSKLLSHPYDEDWYIHFCLPTKKQKGIAAARIYLY